MSALNAPPPTTPPAPPAELERAWAALRFGGDDRERFDACVRLGLRSVALELARPLGDEALTQALELPEDRVPRDRFVAIARRVADLLVQAGVIEPDAARAFEDTVPAELFRGTDATLVWKDTEGILTACSAPASAIARMKRLVPDEAQESLPRASVLVGVRPPHLLERLWEESAPRRNAYAPRLFVCEPDPGACVLGLADLALRRGLDLVAEMLDAERMVWCVGPAFCERLEAWIADNPGQVPPNTVHLTPGGAERATGERVARALTEARDRQNREERAATAPADARPANARRRVQRVQIFTSRYSAYVRFAAHDFARSLGSLGVEADVVQEPDASAVTNTRYLRDRLAAFHPDLVVNINYNRSHMRGIVPPTVPFVTWVQDAMPQLLVSQDGWKAGEHDYLAGFVYPETVSAFAYDRARTLSWPNAVSETTFHHAPADRSRHGHLACEVAMATRHSEPPRAFVERNLATFGTGTPIGRAAGMIAAGLMDRINACCQPWRFLSADLQALTHEAARASAGAEPAPGPLAVMLNSFTLPLADLVFRQQAATWAGAICERRGWRFRLHGAGWEGHPTLARFARPDLTHGEELRASYQLAGVHLHAAVRGGFHQRIAEIAMSGGVPLVRRTFESVDRSRRCLLNDMHRHAQPDFSMVKGQNPGYWIANHPETMALACELNRLGLPCGYFGMIGNSPSELAQIASTAPDLLPGVRNDPNRLLVDLSETTFESEQDLEARIEAMLNGDRRASLSAAISGRCRERVGLSRFARAMIEMVERR